MRNTGLSANRKTPSIKGPLSAIEGAISLDHHVSAKTTLFASSRDMAWPLITACEALLPNAEKARHIILESAAEVILRLHASGVPS